MKLLINGPALGCPTSTFGQLIVDHQSRGGPTTSGCRAALDPNLNPNVVEPIHHPPR
eukprot:CAMPEP_0181169306 /NCGR_PEP_ID=MMETSP1096-20121128/744_1 /TAXON_ID=156174 ORGANISM="Chrysochromulina ericina, Strain CCMP281" /NCGR_SAMPLE_ID=MMETSP1096 /ASSEMBLY_ACC=CAM_ASM_000453 /LENGTH=56 /DNA_ID=CAMNT_0023256755 /DNA_START=531 /DNA_END=698 /DNA_ORIENTATION=+